MTRYRIVRKGVLEFLSREALPTTDHAQAAEFDSWTEAVIFMFEHLDDWSLWHVVPVRCAACGAAA